MLAIATTTVTISRAVVAPDTADPFDAPPARTPVASGVRAVIGSPRGRKLIDGSSQETVVWRLDADPCDLRADDLVVDDTTGDAYTVTWARTRTAVGLNHIEAELQQVSARNPVLA